VKIAPFSPCCIEYRVKKKKKKKKLALLQHGRWWMDLQLYEWDNAHLCTTYAVGWADF
jgi:hypothetical protein